MTKKHARVVQKATAQPTMLLDEVDAAVANTIAMFRKQLQAEGLQGAALAGFDAKMAMFRQRFVQKATARLGSLMLEIGKDMMAELEAEFGRIVRH